MCIPQCHVTFGVHQRHNRVTDEYERVWLSGQFILTSVHDGAASQYIPRVTYITWSIGRDAGACYLQTSSLCEHTVAALFIIFISSRNSWDWSVGIRREQGLYNRGFGSRFPGVARDFTPQCANGQWAYPPWYSVGIVGIFPGSKAAGAWKSPLLFI